MTPNRRISIIAGTLLILATAASLVATGLAPSLSGPDYLESLTTRSGAMATSLLLSLMAAWSSVGIAIALYAVLRRTHPTLALGSVAFRTIEATFYIVGVVSWMTVLSIATSTAAEAQPTSQAISDALVSAHDRAGVAAVSAFVIGGLMYYVALYRTRLVPRWLSGWGIAAMPLMAIACALALYSSNPVTSYVPLAVPIGVQEIVFGLWLMIKGFSTPPAVEAPSVDNAIRTTTAATDG
ncbi:MAG TPA: DUF4386 domain-containing protein [Microlunatus sp.]|nr:DUF4386 domain-containing protein [Microlunatus sp.]